MSSGAKNEFAIKGIVILCCLIYMAVTAHAQNAFEIFIPVDRSSKLTQLSETGNILEQLEAHARSIKKERCFEQIKSDIKEELNHEVFYIHNSTPYKLLIDYGVCKLVSLEADLGLSTNASTGAMTYTIETYEEVISAETKAKNTVDLTPRHALLATYQENGKWVAVGPYNTTDEPFATEQEAIARLFYKAADMKLLCKAGKYQVYALNMPLEYDARDVKKLIEQDGVDFPDGITDKKPDGFSGNRRSVLLEKYDGNVEAKYILFTSANRSRIVAKFTNLTEDKKASIILKPKDGKIIVKTIPPAVSTNLVFDGSDFELQVVYNNQSKQESEINIIDFIKGTIRKHITKDIFPKQNNLNSTPAAVMGVRG